MRRALVIAVALALAALAVYSVVVVVVALTRAGDAPDSGIFAGAIVLISLVAGGCAYGARSLFRQKP